MPSSDLLNSRAFPSRSRQKCLKIQSNQLRLKLLGTKHRKPAFSELHPSINCSNLQFYGKKWENLKGEDFIYLNLQCLLPLQVDLLPHHLCYPSVARISFISVIGTMRKTISGKPGFISDPSSHGNATAEEYRAGASLDVEKLSNDLSALLYTYLCQ